MGTYDTIMDENGKWVFIIPVEYLYLTESINREFQIGQVLFVSASKLPRIRKRLGLKSRISEIAKPFHEVFEKVSTFAVVRQNGNGKDVKAQCYQLVRDAVSILSCSILGYSHRESFPRIAICGEMSQGIRKHFLYNTETQAIASGLAVTKHSSGLVIDKTWKACQKRYFFHKLLPILDRKTKVHCEWRNTLRRVAILLGESVMTYDTTVAFLWNMVVLEMLLTEQGDKYRDVLPKRIEAFLGWIGFWKQERFVERIDEVYSLRCKLVHDGDTQGITAKHLEFTDNLLISLLTNIVNYPTLFYSKKAILDFTEKVAAEHLLGLKSKVRPKRLILVGGRDYGDANLEVPALEPSESEE